MSGDQTTDPPLQKPPRLTGRWISIVLGLTVGVVVGLAPVLGTVAVPRYVPLSAILPDDVRSWVLPLISFLIGLVAALVQFYLTDRYSKATLRKWILIPVAVTVAGVIMLTRSVTLGVVTVPYDGGDNEEVFVVGVGDRPERCNTMCPITISDVQCIKNLTMDQANVATCWGDSRMRSAQLAMGGWYMLAMVGFGVVAAFVLARSRTKSGLS